jgi:hypothetical protein
VKASNAHAGDRFGFSLTPSGDGNTLAAGSYDEDGSGRASTGCPTRGRPIPALRSYSDASTDGIGQLETGVG